MPYNFVTAIFHAKKLCSRVSSSEVRFYAENNRFVFVSPLWGLGATYDDHRVATRPGMSRICAMLSCVPARQALGRQMSGFQGAVKMTIIIK